MLNIIYQHQIKDYNLKIAFCDFFFENKVFLVTYFFIYYMGYVGIEVGLDLSEKYNLKDIEILKVEYHVSKKGSMGFINKVNLKYLIIMWWFV